VLESLDLGGFTLSHTCGKMLLRYVYRRTTDEQLKLD